MHAGTHFGTMTQSIFDGHSDFAKIQVTNDWVLNATYYEAVEVNTVQVAVDDFIGQAICKSGARTGWTCGSILGRHFEPKAGTQDFRRASACSFIGDSGAPVVLTHLFGRAAGVDSGAIGPYQGAFDCADYDIVYAHAAFIDNALNVTIRTIPN